MDIQEARETIIFGGLRAGKTSATIAACKKFLAQHGLAVVPVEPTHYMIQAMQTEDRYYPEGLVRGYKAMLKVVQERDDNANS